MASDRHRSRTGLAVLVLVALLLVTIDYRQGSGGAVAAIQRGFTTVFAPIQEGFATTVRPIGNFFGSIAELGTLRDQNAALEEELQQLREQRVSMADLQRENAELRGQLEMRERLGFTTTGAQVIAQPATVFDNTMLIDIGADSGVAPGMAVINSDGLVGKLIQVTRRNARVQLLTSPEATYAARIAESGEDGLLSGRGSRPFQLEIFDPEATIDNGAEVVTHAFQGTSIPDGIPIGVVEAQVDPETSPRFLAVRPFVDFTRLNTVQVVLDAPLQPTTLPDDELVEDDSPPRPPPPPAVEEDEEDGADDEEPTQG
jgi:rod shape-determining protein MreC